MTKTTPFDFFESVSYGKKNLIEEGREEKEYLPFLVNKALSFHHDGVLYANEMNMLHSLPPKLQYEYLLAAVRQRHRRGGKWPKPEESEAIEAIVFFYGLSPKKAAEALTILSVDHVQQLIKEMKNYGSDH